ncbi:hypothetical protein G9C98_002995 [Cotesia typhae]|uniref:Uncharacterized protein n=1 Tax=Cotesia typhae TaxID=2053667 RepID=A0A8J5V6N6_9HYME|nr:hypothetical protein G9C98_002995 [Cotesia typhae]
MLIKLRRTVLSIFTGLFLANFTEIPNMQTPVGATASKNSLIVRGPLNLEDLVLVRLEGVKLEFQVPKIPEGDSFVSASCS